MKLLISLFSSLLMLVGCNTSAEWNIKDYGAVPDGTTLNTKAIQSAIDACSLSGGGTVVVEGGDYVTATIIIKDNVTLHINKDARIIGTKDIYAYEMVDPFKDATGQLRGKCLIGALGAKNIGIEGQGVIEGNGEAFTNLYGEMIKKFDTKGMSFTEKRGLVCTSPFMVRFVGCDGISIKDVKMNQPGAWCVHLYECNDFVVDGLRIYSHATRNNDGIDIDSSSNGEIMNCDINSGDDAICFKSTSPRTCENVHVHDCKLSSGWGAIKFGTESMGDMRNILCENCEIYNTRGGGVKVLSADGSNISNVTIRNLTMQNVEMPIFVRISERRRTYRDAKQRPVGSIKGLHISNIEAVVSPLADLRMSPPSGILVSGTPDHKITDLTIENVNITLPGGGTEADAKVVMPENIDQYPEYSHLGVSPTYGMFVRNTEVFNYKNINFKLSGDDAREQTKFQNVDKINNL
ncbi:MAG: glycosyl hydrolase family 28 protein [Rikenellaceae bacterium]